MNRFLARALAAAGCTAVLLASLPAHAVTPTAQPVSTEKVAVVDLNHASAAELEGLPGIGPSRAQAIVKYRTEKGGFSAASEITEIKGIGPSLAKRLEPMLTVTPVKK